MELREQLDRRLARLDPEKRRLAEAWLGGQGPARPATPVLPSYLLESTWPLSPEQQAFLFETEIGGGLYASTPSRNQWAVLKLRGNLDVAAVKTALLSILRRHEGLRARLGGGPDSPRMEIGPEPDSLALIERDLRPLGAAGRAAADAEFARACAEPFNLRAGPLTQFFLFRLADEEHLLGVLIDHVIFDGWSFGIVISEFSEFYTAAHTGRPPRVATLKRTYGDYVRWAQSQRKDAAWAPHLAYWLERLAGAPVPQLPTDRARADPQPYAGGKLHERLSSATAQKVFAFARAQGVSVFSVLQAVFKVLIWGRSGERDLSIVCAEANRDLPELADVIGCFSTCLTIRTILAEDISFEDFVAVEHRAVLEALSHKSAPFDAIVEHLWPEGPPFQLLFAYENFPTPKFGVVDVDVTIEDINYASGVCDLVLCVSPHEGEFRCDVCYNANLFDAATVRDLVGDYARLIDALLDHPERTPTRLEAPRVGFHGDA